MLQTDPEKASMPKDGTVHELTNRVGITLVPHESFQFV
jgi:hypothetical protein